ncbi:hypothetical protein J7J49_07225 [Halomonas sp. ISL-56]|uniref:hypothetical protein n=1 Tax=Halomonas sp. ISL-56 TaxID=2819149 RepID=UPI001BE80B62|nr:hypothetical protein [Halomonas sp. ISL-56]MBT2801111.1 hypothetical protein [Halomonas sp. ISL-56]
MIYLNKENMVFLKPRKVAGTSFEMALSRFALNKDIVTPISPDDEQERKNLGFCSCQNYLDQNGKQIFNNHISAADAKNKLERSIWEEAEKCAIVRNPFDVYVSLFYYHNGREADISKLSDWYLGGRGTSYLGVNHKQYFIKGEMIIDRFIRYENFEEDILELEKSVPSFKGLYDTFRNIKAKSGVRSNASYELEAVYSKHPDLKSEIGRLHSFEITNFGYTVL